MSDIFISYAREDRQQAQDLARGFEAQGWSVWWDTAIPAGRTFDEVIDEAVDAAKCMIVIWSKLSVQSRYVHGEAQDGADRDILVPVLIERGIRIPRAFRAIQAADLVGWDGADTSRSFLKLVDDVARILGPAPIVSRSERRDIEDDSQRDGSKRHERQEDILHPTAGTPGCQRERQHETTVGGASKGAEDKSASRQIRHGPRKQLIFTVGLTVVLLSIAAISFWYAGHRQIKPGEIFHDRLGDGSQGPAMVVIPAGSFLMGEVNDEAVPRPTITIHSPFAMSKQLITYNDYDKFSQADGRELEPSFFDIARGNYPVNVRWHDAVAYAEWLSSETGKHYRLPSESEWEYAARGGTDTDYWWGDDIGSPRPRYSEDSMPPTADSFEPNAFGIAVTVHYVWEWVQDCWHPSDGAKRPLDGSVWLGGDCLQRIVRGGEGFRVWERDAAEPDWEAGGDPIGFRVVREID